MFRGDETVLNEYSASIDLESEVSTDDCDGNRMKEYYEAERNIKGDGPATYT